MQRASLRVQGKKTVSGEMGGPSKVKGGGGGQALPAEGLEGLEVSRGQEGVPTLGEDEVSPLMNRWQGSLGQHAVTEQVQVVRKGIPKREDGWTIGADKWSRGEGER